MHLLAGPVRPSHRVTWMNRRGILSLWLCDALQGQKLELGRCQVADCGPLCCVFTQPLLSI